MINLLKSFFIKQVPLVLVDSDPMFRKILYKLSLEKTIGIDTEFDWRNTYFPKLSLIQISTNEKIYLIDCLKLNSLREFRPIFENKNIKKVFHAVRSDVTVLFCTTNLKVTNCFDIQIADRYLSKSDAKSYAKIVFKYLRIKIDKSETNSDWLRRPFSKNQINYAANDVRFLIKIYKKQKKILEKRNLYSNVNNLVNKEVFLGSQKLYISRLKRLKLESKIEKKLFMWRENKAIEKNIPPSFIFKDKYFKKILKTFEYNISNENIFYILKNDSLANELINEFKEC